MMSTAAVCPVALSFVLALSEADSPMLLWLIVGGLMALGPVMHSYIKVYEWFKGKSVDTSAFVTRTELGMVRAERDAQIKDTFEDIKEEVTEVRDDVGALKRQFDEFLKTYSADMAALNRSLGRLEGN